jgi:hypothetical protein
MGKTPTVSIQVVIVADLRCSVELERVGTTFAHVISVTRDGNSRRFVARGEVLS